MKRLPRLMARFRSAADEASTPHSAVPRPPTELNRFQAAFCEWNALRLGISIEASRRRFEASQSALPDGHAGAAFRAFNDLGHALFSVFADDSESEVYDAYRLHAPAHFLRTLAYAEPRWLDSNPVVRWATDLDDVVIVDFGCGLAQASITLAEVLAKPHRSVSLHLADISTLRFEFLKWFVDELGIDAHVYECTPTDRVPPLPTCDIIVAREFFEHVHDPVFYLDRLDASLRPGGMLVTAVSDHRPEFMHVSPNLTAVRRRLHDFGYTDVVDNRILQKGGSPVR